MVEHETGTGLFGDTDASLLLGVDGGNVSCHRCCEGEDEFGHGASVDSGRVEDLDAAFCAGGGVDLVNANALLANCFEVGARGNIFRGKP